MEDGGAARERRKGIARRNEEESQRKDDGPAASHRPATSTFSSPLCHNRDLLPPPSRAAPPTSPRARAPHTACLPSHSHVPHPRSHARDSPPRVYHCPSPFLCARSNVSLAAKAFPPPRTSVAPPRPPLPRAANFLKRKSATHLVKKRERPL
ncbi:hypothetical protein B0H14DRAFT_2956408, partial [Mycena olivaceomarginata]